MKTLSVYCPTELRGPNSLQNVFSDLNRCVESFFGDSIFAPAAGIFSQMPAVDIQENDNAYTLDMELPGCDEKSINVHIDGSNLTVASRQEEEKNEDKEAAPQGVYLLRERKISSFTRSFKLPENADPQTASASFKNGVLRLEIKKRAETQKRVVQINAA